MKEAYQYRVYALNNLRVDPDAFARTLGYDCYNHMVSNHTPELASLLETLTGPHGPTIYKMIQIRKSNA